MSDPMAATPERDPLTPAGEVLAEHSPFTSVRDLITAGMALVNATAAGEVERDNARGYLDVLLPAVDLLSRTECAAVYASIRRVADHAPGAAQRLREMADAEFARGR